MRSSFPRIPTFIISLTHNLSEPVLQIPNICYHSHTPASITWSSLFSTFIHPCVHHSRSSLRSSFRSRLRSFLHCVSHPHSSLALQPRGHGCLRNVPLLAACCTGEPRVSCTVYCSWSGALFCQPHPRIIVCSTFLVGHCTSPTRVSPGRSLPVCTPYPCTAFLPASPSALPSFLQPEHHCFKWQRLHARYI